MSTLTPSALTLGLFLLATPSHAAPQGHVAARTALCGSGSEGRVWQKTRWCNGLVADLLFLRERNRDLGLGPYLEVGTAGFFDARFGGGASLLVPVTESYPLVLSLGVYDHEFEALALGGSVFWGARSYNFDGAYNYALGLYASVQRDLGADRETRVTAGLEIDGFFFAAPVLLMIGAFR